MMTLNTIKKLLSEMWVDFFPDVECEVEGEVKIMHEYRIMVEDGSEQHKMLEELLNSED